MRELVVGPDVFRSERSVGTTMIWLRNAGRLVGWLFPDASGRWELTAFDSCRGWLNHDYARRVRDTAVAAWRLDRTVVR